MASNVVACTEEFGRQFASWLRMPIEHRSVILKDRAATERKAMIAARSEYDALSPAERNQYDRMTEGMMPRVAR